jgi:opacity protein-like surface antigen
MEYSVGDSSNNKNGLLIFEIRQQMKVLFAKSDMLKEKGIMQFIRLMLAIISGFLVTPAFAESDGSTAARDLYFGVFGGGGTSSGGDVTQRGTVYFIEAQGGPLAVNATGNTNSSSRRLFGVQFGHEWSRGSQLAAFEFEGLYLPSHRVSARLENSASAGRIGEQTFDDSFDMSSVVTMGNLVVGFPKRYPGVTPYVGGGIGLARVDISGANSTQISPTEPGINHFNSGTGSSAWTVAAQIKAGVRWALGDSAYAFGEYRFLYVDATDQNFGPTAYPTHAPTSDWQVRFDDTSYHFLTAGIGLSF